ncbi:hypothetical protein VPH35_099356 [Triticum aestivum]|uniref:Uncharacterized protein n=1 Tax=Aegilops tauschii subsp. strangulata TaxID=200361 RepID=A0A453LIZ4_AEGTS
MALHPLPCSTPPVASQQSSPRAASPREGTRLIPALSSVSFLFRVNSLLLHTLNDLRVCQSCNEFPVTYFHNVNGFQKEKKKKKKRRRATFHPHDLHAFLLDAPARTVTRGL